MEELLTILLGTNSYQSYLAAQILGLIGFTAMCIINYYYRTDKTIPWSFNKWVRENWPLVSLLIIGMYIGLRWQSDLTAGINTYTTDLAFVTDKWLWFVVGGFLFRMIIHQANKLVRKLISSE